MVLATRVTSRISMISHQIDPRHHKLKKKKMCYSSFLAHIFKTRQNNGGSGDPLLLASTLVQSADERSRSPVTHSASKAVPNYCTCTVGWIRFKARAAVRVEIGDIKQGTGSKAGGDLRQTMLAGDFCAALKRFHNFIYRRSFERLTERG